MSIRTVVIRTAADGSYTYNRNLFGTIRAVALEIGDLDTPDIEITDETHTTTILSVTGVSADSTWAPSGALSADDGTDLASSVGEDEVGAYGPAVCMGELQIAVTGAGDTKRGKLRILYDG